MFCNKCGKYMDYVADVCKECDGNAVQPKASTDTGRRSGRGKAVIGLVLGVVSYVLILLSMPFDSDNTYRVLATFVPSAPLTIIALFLGIFSIRHFVKTKAPAAKPIPTLVLGIITTFITGLGLTFSIQGALILIFSI